MGKAHLRIDPPSGEVNPVIKLLPGGRRLQQALKPEAVAVALIPSGATQAMKKPWMGRSVGLSGGRIRSAWGARVVSRLPRSGGEVLLEYAMLPADNPAYGLVEYGFFFLLLIFNVF